MISQEETQDTIRVACIHTALVLANNLSKDDLKQHVVSVITAVTDDSSWRVRLTVARAFHKICVAFGPEITSQHLLATLVSFLKDQELEVRKEAVKIIDPCLQSKSLNNEQLQNYIVPQFQTLALDGAQPVRAALAQVIGRVAKELGRDTTQKVLLPIVTDLMKDEFHDVRLNIVNDAALFFEVLGMDAQTHTLLNTIQGLIMDN